MGKNLKPKLKRLILRILFLPVGLFRKWFILPRKIKLIKNKINALQNRAVSVNNLGEQIFFASSFRVNSMERQEIFKTAFFQSFRDLKSKLPLKVMDASDEPFASANKEFLENFSGISLEYTNKKESLNRSFNSLLGAANQPYFCMLLEDLPMFGLDEDFLASCCGLLRDFEGLVDLIFPEAVEKFVINELERTISFDLDGRDFKLHSESLIGTVTYGKHTFAILKNFHTGFFFNDFIASRKKYLQKLVWYRKYIHADDPHLVELAASVKVGPIFDFLAVPMSVFNFDMDYAHTDSSIRKEIVEAKDLAEALQEGYKLEEKGESFVH